MSDRWWREASWREVLNGIVLRKLLQCFSDRGGPAYGSKRTLTKNIYNQYVNIESLFYVSSNDKKKRQLDKIALVKYK